MLTLFGFHLRRLGWPRARWSLALPAWRPSSRFTDRIAAFNPKNGTASTWLAKPQEALHDQLGLRTKTDGTRTPTKIGAPGDTSEASAQLALYKLAKEDKAPLLGSASLSAAGGRAARRPWRLSWIVWPWRMSGVSIGFWSCPCGGQAQFHTGGGVKVGGAARGAAELCIVATGNWHWVDMGFGGVTSPFA